MTSQMRNWRADSSRSMHVSKCELKGVSEAALALGSQTHSVWKDGVESGDLPGALKN